MCQWWGASRGLRASSTLWNLVLKLPGRPFQAVLCVSARKSALIDSSWLEFTLIFYFCLLVNCKELFKITCRCLSLHMGMCRYMQLSLEASALDPLGLVWWLWDAGSQTPVLEEQQASCPLNHLSSPKNSFSSSFFFFKHSLFVKQRSYFQTLITRPSQISYMCSHVYSNFSALFLWLPTHPKIFHLFGFLITF